MELKKSICFVCLVFVFYIGFSKICSSPKGNSWAARTGLENVRKFKNQYDVVVLGSSVSIANISCQRLYEKYGIYSVCVGEPEQPVFLSKHTLYEVLEYQTPKVVMLTTRSLFYSQNDAETKTKTREDYIVHNALDGIKNRSVKKAALLEVAQYNPSVDFWNYFSPIYYSHGNWKRLSKQNFKSVSYFDCMNGNIAATETEKNFVSPYNSSNPQEITPIDERIEKSAKEIIDVCKANGISFVFLNSDVNSTKGWHNAVENLSQKYDVAFIDVNEHINEIDFDCTTDLNDANHFNLGGAIKLSDFLGIKLSLDYGVGEFAGFFDEGEVKEKSKSIQTLFKKQQEAFELQKIGVAHRRAYFNEYLDMLFDLDLEEYAIFISVFDEASGALSDESAEKLEKLGLSLSMKGKWRHSYCAVIQKDSIKEKIDTEELVSIKEAKSSYAYEVASCGLNGEWLPEKICIKINGKQVMKKKRGFNFVVYNIPNKYVVSSVFFDTCGNENPEQGRIY